MIESLSNITKELIASSMISAMQETKRITEQKETPTHMGSSRDKWDFIIKHINKNINEQEFQIDTICYGGDFQILLIYELKSQNLLSLMRDSTYKNFLDQRIGINHYLRSFTGFNDGLTRKEEQICFDLPNVQTLNNYHENKISKKKKKALQVLRIDEKDINNYITIVFEEKDFIVTKINLYLTNSYLEILENEDISNYIKPYYKTNTSETAFKEDINNINNDGNDGNDSSINNETYTKDDADLNIKIKKREDIK